MRRRVQGVAVATVLLLQATGVAMAAGAQDPAGDVESEGNPPALTANETMAIDIATMDATVGADVLVVDLTMQGPLANRRVSNESGHVLTFWQGDDTFWGFVHFDAGPQYFSIYRDDAGDTQFSEECTTWSTNERDSTATYRIEPACFPGLDRSKPVQWVASAGWSDDETGDSWFDVAPDQSDALTSTAEMNSAPPLDFSGFGSGGTSPSPSPQPDPDQDPQPDPGTSGPTRPTPKARDTSDTCAGKAPQQQFSDTRGTTHAGAIDCISHHQITQGREDGTFGPKDDLGRGQTATFLVKTLEAAGRTVPMASGICNGTAVHTDSYERLVAAGIVEGPSDGACRITDRITRAEMAQWVHSALAWSGQNFPRASDYYDDDEGHVAEKAINQVTERGIVTGSGNAKFQPDISLQRGQMATFLARLLDALRAQ